MAKAKVDTLVVEVKLSVIVTMDAAAQPLTKAVVAEEAASWLSTLIEHGEIPGAVDSWQIVDAYNTAEEAR